MTLALYGILIILALFIVLMVFNPRLSCFGRKLKSPLYPILRKKKQKRMQTTDYGFHLVEPVKKGTPSGKEGLKRESKPADYGFDLGGRGRDRASREEATSGKPVAEEYGFDLREHPKRKKDQDIKEPDEKPE